MLRFAELTWRDIISRHFVNNTKSSYDMKHIILGTIFIYCSICLITMLLSLWSSPWVWAGTKVKRLLNIYRTIKFEVQHNSILEFIGCRKTVWYGISFSDDRGLGNKAQMLAQFHLWKINVSRVWMGSTCLKRKECRNFREQRVFLMVYIYLKGLKCLRSP